LCPKKRKRESLIQRKREIEDEGETVAFEAMPLSPSLRIAACQIGDWCSWDWIRLASIPAILSDSEA